MDIAETLKHTETVVIRIFTFVAKIDHIIETSIQLISKSFTCTAKIYEMLYQEFHFYSKDL